MATYNTPLITTQGLSLLKAEIAGNDSVTFTKIVFSSDDYSQTADSSVQALTALSSLDLTATARSFTDVNGNLKIRGVANNQNTTSAFYIKTYGLYGKNKAGNEMLIAVSTAQNANFVPAYNNKQTNQIAYTFNIAVSSTNNITLSSSTDVDVTQADLAGINNAVNSNASSLTAQQSSYASSLNSAFSSNNNSISSAFSSNSSNLASLQSSVATNSNSIESLQENAITYKGQWNSPDFSTMYRHPDGIWILLNQTDSNLPSAFNGYGNLTLTTSNNLRFAVLQDNQGNTYTNTYTGSSWTGWIELATQYDVQAIDSTATSLASSLAVQNSAISSNVAANSSAIANASNSLDSAVNSVSISNNAVSSSIASTVSTNQANIATNNSAISNLQSSAATNSSAISSNATNISTNSSAISSMQSALAQNANNLASFIKTTVSSQYLANGTDFNTVTQSGMYSIQNGYQSYPNAYYPGTDGILVVFNDGTSEVLQQVITLDGTGGVRINYRMQGIGGVWSRWIALATVDDLASTALCFKGIAPGNTLSSITTSGIYDLNGKSYTDWLDPTNLWGQLIVINTGGVCNQRFQNNVSNSWLRTINSWGITPWRRLDQ